MAEDPDVILICGSNRYPCHRQVLSKHSPYFAAMFSSPMLESTSKEITLRVQNNTTNVHLTSLERPQNSQNSLDVSSSALKTLIEFAYSHKFQATSRTVHSVLEAASMFHFDSVQEACIDFLLANLTIKNCLSVMCCADRLGIPKLLQASRQMVLWEFSSVISGKEFFQLEAPGVAVYLFNDGLRLNSELEVFDAINKWIEHDPDERKETIIKLMETIRFREVSTVELNDMLRKEWVKSNPECVRLLTCVRKLKAHEGKNRKLNIDDDMAIIARRLLDTPSRFLPLVPAVIGRGFEGDERSNVMYFDVKTNEMIKLCELNKVMSNGHVATGFRACVVGQRIYLMGGEFYLGCSNWNETMWSLDTFRNSWEYETKLRIKRRHQCVCVLDEYIYLIGGIGQFRVVLDKVERYNTNDKTWQTLASIPTPTYASACTSHKNKIYLLTNQVHCYDPKMDVWTTLRRSDLPNEYGFHAALSHLNGIYLVGQHSKDLTIHFTNCEDRGDDKKAYAILGHFEYSTSNACIVGDKIYSFGYNDDLAVVEVYDIIKKEFRILNNNIKGVKAPNLSNGCFPLPMYQ